MMAVSETNGKNKADVHYVIADIPCVVEEIGGHYNEQSDLELQESVYQSFQMNVHNDVARGSSSTGSWSQLEEDEALARALQESENRSAVISPSGTTASLADVTPKPSTANGGSTSADTSTQVAGEDDIDPDRMTYEELQSLGEALGAESKGLSDELISYLPTSTYKIRFFSRKDKHEECVICCMPYKNKERLMTLPCQHHYHSKCISRWLKINKACPVCNVDVFGS